MPRSFRDEGRARWVRAPLLHAARVHQIGAASAIENTRDYLQFGLRVFRRIRRFNSRRGRSAVSCRSLQQISSKASVNAESQFGQALATISFRDGDRGVWRRRVEIGIDKFDRLVHAVRQQKRGALTN